MEHPENRCSCHPAQAAHDTDCPKWNPTEAYREEMEYALSEPSHPNWPARLWMLVALAEALMLLYRR